MSEPRAPSAAGAGQPAGGAGQPAAVGAQALDDPSGLSPGLVRLMAVTCAVTVANLYYAQPLLHSIGSDLHVSQGSASLLVTVGQAGYALGLLFIVPAGDIIRRRPLLTALLACCALTLAASALAPSLLVLDVAAGLAGVTSVVVQMLVPYAATLASDRERSRVIGTLMGGLLIGILLSRTFAGVVAGFAGWRAVYGIAAGFMALTAVMLRRALPDHGPQLAISYREQLRGVLRVARAEPALRWRSLIAACGFGSFACFWTTVTFLLAGPQFGFSQLDIGLFALVGAAGAITSMAAGRLLDARPGLRWPASGAALALLAVAYLPIGLGGAHLGAAGLVLLIVGVLLMDACVQASHVINQSVIYDLLPEARSRLTTVYITTMFAGGAIGSAAGAQAYAHWGWTGATLTAAALPLAGLLCWLATRRHEHPA
ncbi:MFS transporter [Trebonia kvetii]|uniref:MFS transporter n=1 Tax=Trebonia kvetii TaxID=2480626 RepID=A0A6P2CAM9_9ACTN|nr:MFS transporter [Trebonia kvetii]TVZ07001.1 MFS transporter [Trebonia kvetii]